MQFSKEDVVYLNMCSNYSLTNVFLKMVLKQCSENFVKLAEVYPWRSLLPETLQYLELPLFWTKQSAKYNLLGICEIFNITNSTNLDCQMWFQ